MPGLIGVNKMAAGLDRVRQAAQAMSAPRRSTETTQTAPRRCRWSDGARARPAKRDRRRRQTRTVTFVRSELLAPGARRHRRSPVCNRAGGPSSGFPASARNRLQNIAPSARGNIEDAHRAIFSVRFVDHVSAAISPDSFCAAGCRASRCCSSSPDRSAGRAASIPAP